MRVSVCVWCGVCVCVLGGDLDHCDGIDREWLGGAGNRLPPLHIVLRNEPSVATDGIGCA